MRLHTQSLSTNAVTATVSSILIPAPGAGLALMTSRPLNQYISGDTYLQYGRLQFRYRSGNFSVECGIDDILYTDAHAVCGLILSR